MSSLVHADGELCRWCGDEPATTVLYSWPTGLVCAAGNAKLRVQRWLRMVGRKNRRT